MRSVWVLLLLLLRLALAASAGVRGATVDVGTPWGTVRGAVDAARNVSSFLGIPFAQPPLGALRWRDPRPPQPWAGVRDATRYGPVCVQGADDGTRLDTPVGSEDCLLLNVFAPGDHFDASADAFADTSAGALRPVLFYIHGGGNIFGSADDPLIDPTQLVAAARDVVVVTIQYRLNVFGYLALAELSSESDSRTSGNYGLADALAALRWVQQGIARFGGDPKRVVLFGQSSGGTNALALLMSPLARGLFSAAVSWSGSPKIDQLLADVEAANVAFYAANGCAPRDLPCLRAGSAEDVFKNIPWRSGPWWDMSQQFGEITRPPHQVSGGLVIVDGHIVPRPSWEAFADPALLLSVPAVLATVANEIDLGPNTDVRGFTGAQWRAFLNASLSWHSPELVALVEAFYPANASQFHGDLEDVLEQQVNDVRVFCGNRQLAEAACSAASAPMYLVQSVHRPGGGRCAYFAPWEQEYPYHMIDMLAFFNTTPAPPPCHVAASDLAFGAVWQNAILSLARDPSQGLPSEWARYCDSSSSRGVVNLVSSAGVELAPEHRASKCAFWSSLRMPDSGQSFTEAFSWNN